MSTMVATPVRTGGMTSDERFVILASSLGTVFEWYDFYIYGSLGRPSSALNSSQPIRLPPAIIFALLAFAAGFLVRPFGAIVFGRVGDMVGRKYTFLITIIDHGSFAPSSSACLPNAATIGFAAPIILIGLRLVQGLALGGEYGGAATYVAEHAPNGQTRLLHLLASRPPPTLGLFLSLLVILFTRTGHRRNRFRRLGLADSVPASRSSCWSISIWIRLRLNELPIFQKMKDEGTELEAHR